MESEFKNKLQAWLEDVATTCDKYAREIDRDFYPFQSQVFQNPELLIIGANPGNDGDYKSFVERNKRGRLSSELSNCGENGENAYIAYKDDPEWKINKPILKMFEVPKMRRILESAVIMNVIYFNTKKVVDLKKFSVGNQIIDYCKAKTLELIVEIVKPKAVLVLGYNDAPKWLGINVSTTKDSILRTKDDKSALIMKVDYLGIPWYMIHHSSMNFSFNAGENLCLKKAEFEKIFGAV